MGQSTDAILVFGHEYGEDPEVFPWYDEEEGDHDEEKWWYDQHGLAKRLTEIYEIWGEWEKDMPYAQHNERSAQFAAAFPELAAEKEALHEARRALGDMPVEVVRHCSGDYPMYILAVPGTKVRASRGHPEVIDPKSFITTISVDAWQGAAEFCKKWDIEFKPQWFLVSYWSY